MNVSHHGPLIDVHAHFVTDGYVDAAKTAGHGNPDGMPGYPSWDARVHLDLMDQWGIQTSVLSISSPGVHFGDDEDARALAREVKRVSALKWFDSIRRALGTSRRYRCPMWPARSRRPATALEELGSDGLVMEDQCRGELPGRRAATSSSGSSWIDGGLWCFVHPTSSTVCSCRVARASSSDARVHIRLDQSSK